MTKCTKFIENELDRINEYICMAQSALVVPREICSDNEKMFLTDISDTDKEIMDILLPKLNTLSLRLDETKKIIKDFKNYYFEKF